MFSVEQKRLLEAPLNSVNVKSRSQSGRTLSYIEGWHAIAEANRIFGFDAWSRETIDLKCVSEKAR
jgi:DNA repair and recombination protein RAD52